MVYSKDTNETAKKLRKCSLEMVHRAKASHIGSALSICDILAVLYGKVLRVMPTDPLWRDRDRFILSKGHACVALYATLAEMGYFETDRLLSYGKDHSDFMNHISHKVPGVEFSTGSLGHGLPFATGKALAAKRQNKGWRSFVLMSDGELDEGSNWESLMFASHHNLDNLIAVIDYNNLQSLTTVCKTLTIEPLVDKFTSFGWEVQEVNGHDHDQLADCLMTAPWRQGKPSIVIAKTIKGKGVSFMENSVAWHYKSPTDEQLEEALAEIENA